MAHLAAVHVSGPWYEKSTEKVEISEGGNTVTDLKLDTGN